MDKLEIYNETGTVTPNLDFCSIKNQILGETFDLTISILNSRNSQKINKKQRKQDYVPNVLSFKYSESSGEIIFTPEVIDGENYEVDTKILTSYNEKFLYLFIHSLLHLKDLDHSKEMEEEEEFFFHKFQKEN
jgi:rRNA maturation RNase YbeY